MDRFAEAIKRIDAANKADPRIEQFQGKHYPATLLYGRRMTTWLERLAPLAPETVKLAARAQHICRWMIPRKQFPQGRVGYLKWRKTLYGFHAGKAAAILKESGYEDPEIARVQSLLKKENLKTDPDMQLLEDVICLVFLENYLSDFSKAHEEEKIVQILHKTWRKMSPHARDVAMTIAMTSEVRSLVEKAVKF